MPEVAMPEAEAFETGSGGYAARPFKDGVFTEASEQLVEETPVALSYNGRPHAVMMATPTDLEDFATGFSLAEGIVDAVAEISSIEVVPSRHGVAVMLSVPADRAERLDRLRRSLPGMGGCGLCGVEDLDAAIRIPLAVGRELRITPASVGRAFDALPNRQTLGRRTGAAHAAAFASPGGELLAVREDAARHNAMDKLIGCLARQGTAPRSGFAVVTSRASYELAQKASSAGFELLAAISAPTGLAVRLAQHTGLTLVGFARDKRFTCYANAFRLGA